VFGSHLLQTGFWPSLPVARVTGGGVEEVGQLREPVVDGHGFEGEAYVGGDGAALRLQIFQVGEGDCGAGSGRRELGLRETSALPEIHDGRCELAIREPVFPLRSPIPFVVFRK